MQGLMKIYIDQIIMQAWSNWDKIKNYIVIHPPILP